MGITEAGSNTAATMMDTPGADESAAVSDELLSELVRGIRAAQARHGFALSAEIGRLVVEGLFGGDVEALARRGPKDLSLRRLAEHPDLPMSATSLHYALGVHRFLARRPDVHSSEHLTPTHVRAVLGLSTSDQDRLLENAERRRLSVSKLVAEVRELRGQGRRRGGRPMLPVFVKSIHAMERFVRGGDDLFAGLDTVNTLDESEALRLFSTVSELRTRCEALQAALRDRALGAGAQDSLYPPVDHTRAVSRRPWKSPRRS
jgi:hypothetical protein